VHVSTRSPSPLSPASVSRRPPAAHASRRQPIGRIAGASLTAGARHFRLTSSPAVIVADEARLLDESWASEPRLFAPVVPLRSASHLLGVLEAHDRQSRWRGFGTADMRLIGTMASHLATALDNRRLLSRLRHDAYHDPLTGLLNRPGFRQAAAEQLRTDPKAMILRIDLDVLSTVSDALGYAWGDRMVAAAARRIKDTLGADSMIARLS